jgi:voltage-gated potassium channel
MSDGRSADRDERLRGAEALARRLDKPMGALGVVFLLVVLGQTVAEDDGVLTVLAVVGWVLWAAFVAELALRAYVARDQRLFWRRNWWQVVFLAVPFLRLVRVLMFLRVARVGGILSAAVRGSRSAGRLLSGRLAWLSVVTVVVILASSQLLFVVGAYDSYRLALHDVALSTVSGEPLSADDATAMLLEVGLAIYSVAVFGVLAGSLGAYFLERRGVAETPTGSADAVTSGSRESVGGEV